MFPGPYTLVYGVHDVAAGFFSPSSARADRARESSIPTRAMSRARTCSGCSRTTRATRTGSSRAGSTRTSSPTLPWWKRAAAAVPPGLHRLHAQAAAGAACRSTWSRSSSRSSASSGCSAGSTRSTCRSASRSSRSRCSLPRVGRRHARAAHQPRPGQPAGAARGGRPAVAQGRARGRARDPARDAAARAPTRRATSRSAA